MTMISINQVILIKKTDIEPDPDNPMDIKMTFLFPLEIFNVDKLEENISKIEKANLFSKSNEETSTPIPAELKNNESLEVIGKILKSINDDEYKLVRLSNLLGLILTKFLDSIVDALSIINEYENKPQKLVEKLFNDVIFKVYQEIVPTTCNYDLNEVSFIKIRHLGKNINWCEKATVHSSCPKEKECPKPTECPKPEECPKPTECPEPTDTSMYTYIIIGLSVSLVLVFIMFLMKK